MNDEDIFDYQSRLLIKEIDTIQSKIADYDDLSFKIKGWAVTLWSAIVVLGTQQQRAEVVGISIVVVLAFWILDAYFKSYQQRSMVRMGCIEDFLNNEGQFSANGLKDAFKHRSFGKFPIHDPIGRLSKKRSKSFKRKYKQKTYLVGKCEDEQKMFFCGSLILPNVYAVYLGLTLAAIVLALSFVLQPYL